MKNKSIWLLLVLMGLAGCKNNNSVDGDNSAPVVKQDTALVLGKYYHFRSSHLLLVADKKGNTKIINPCLEFGRDKIAKFSNVGDTLIAALNEKEPYVIRNLTIENKIKAFSKQK